MQARKSAIYLDVNAGRPLHPLAANAIRTQLDEWTSGRVVNPSSVHSAGREAKKRFSAAREAVLSSLGVLDHPQRGDGVVFTSSCTEANQMAVQSFVHSQSLSSGSNKTFWITTEVEHECHLALVAPLREQGVRVQFLSVDEHGLIRWDILRERLIESYEEHEDARVLLSLLWVNNETGVIQDLSALRAIQEEFPKIWVHLDGAQAWGKIPFRFAALQVDYAGFSGHKVGAPAGVGVLALSHRARQMLSRFSPMPGKQEKGARGGTENLLGILALGAVASELSETHVIASHHLSRQLQRDFEARLLAQLSPSVIRISGGSAPRIPQTSHFTLRGMRGDLLAARLDLEGVRVSTGSACRSGSVDPSHVLLAMGRTREEAMSCLRVSFDSSLVSASDLTECADRIETFVSPLRGSPSGRGSLT